MSSVPLVSVCIPSYNHARFLPEAIESILAQTYRNTEIIIVDDGSTDHSLQIARTFEAKHPEKIKVYTHPNEANLGVSKTADAAISKIKGKYWTACCSDDVWYAGKLARQVEYMESHPQIALAYSYMQAIDEDGRELPKRFGESIENKEDQLESLLKFNPITAPSIIARHEALTRVGGHEENLIFSDWEMWIRFASLYRIGFIAETLVQYRLHTYNQSIGIENLKHLRHLKDMYQVLSEKAEQKTAKISEEKYRRIIDEQIKAIPAKESRAHLDNYYRAVADRNFKRAADSLGKAFAVSPATVLTPRRIGSLVLRAARGVVGFGS